MTNDSGEDDELEERVEFTPDQAANIRQAMSNIRLPTFKLPESMFTDTIDVSRISQTQQSLFSAAFKPALDEHAQWLKQISTSISSDILKNVAPALVKLGQITDQLTKNIDFNGIASSLDIVAKVNATFAEQQSTLLKNLGPAIAALRGSFYPPNLRAIEDLNFENMSTVVMVDGIPLYGLPRATTVDALIQADNASTRRDILGRRWKTISADCREAVRGCSSNTIEPYVPFATAALDALDEGHTAAAQALAGSLIDTVITGYFGDDRYKYTPSKKTQTNDAYDEFTIREYIAFAPMWQAYQQFRVANGDKVPTRFNRHATAHSVSARQYSRRNAVQGLMFACSLLYRLDEEMNALEPTA